MPPQTSQSNSLPAGYTLDTPSTGLPAGYSLDTPAPTTTPTDRLFPHGTAPEVGTVSSAPTGAGAWLGDAENDLLRGGQATWVGKILHAAGANPNGLQGGVSSTTAEQMGSPLLGPIHAAQGIVEIPEHPVAGPLKAIGGALQTAFLPASFVAPEVSQGLSSARQALLPTTEEAGNLFNPITAAAAKIPIDTAPARAIAEEAAAYGKAGAQMPKGLKNFLSKTEPTPASFPNPAEPAPAMFYPEGRLFGSKASSLSAAEKMESDPNMQRLVGKFANALKDANRDAAEQVGMGDAYDEAMSQYAKAKRIENVTEIAKKYVARGIAAGLLGGAGAAGAHAIWKAASPGK